MNKKDHLAEWLTGIWPTYSFRSNIYAVTKKFTWKPQRYIWLDSSCRKKCNWQVREQTRDAHPATAPGKITAPSLIVLIDTPPCPTLKTFSSAPPRSKKRLPRASLGQTLYLWEQNMWTAISRTLFNYFISTSQFQFLNIFCNGVCLSMVRGTQYVNANAYFCSCCNLIINQFIVSILVYI